VVAAAVIIEVEHHGVGQTVAVAVPHQVVHPPVAVEVQRHRVGHTVTVEVGVCR